jgi:hypothetical protein
VTWLVSSREVNRLGEVSIRFVILEGPSRTLPPSIEAGTFGSLNQLLIQNEDFSGVFYPVTEIQVARPLSGGNQQACVEIRR